ncbi:hypothetical protein BgAZ_100870 [Babesia gibsoni]|uniref:Uncharacterized protein n=1 Tax=Babesia gibsoni TaxID=33632 RepID=A0AAD8PF20_BABGI|nr:hypothetical protein BgAZ_100870 [Babesia gibsoni]
MKSQRLLLLCYFAVALTAFYSMYYYKVKHDKPSMLAYNVENLLLKPPVTFSRKCKVYFTDHNGVSNKPLADHIINRLHADGIEGGAHDISLFRHANTPGIYTAVEESYDDMLDLSKTFSIVLRHVATTSHKGDFDVLVNGGSVITFYVTDGIMRSKLAVAKIYDLINAVFFKYAGMPPTNLKPLLDINFSLLSDDKRVMWNIKEDIVSPYIHPIISAFSIFYDINVHSRTISGANLTKRMKLKKSQSGDHSVADLQEQGADFYDMVDRVAAIEVATVDSSIYRHMLAFICHVPHKKLMFYDKLTNKETDSVSINGIGILSLLDIGEHPEEEYVLNHEKVPLVSSWVTHLRKMHNLPTTMTETLIGFLTADDEVTVLSEGHYSIKAPGVSYSMKLSQPGLVAFYGFEVSKIAESLYKLYLKAAMTNMERVVRSIPSMTIIMNVSQRTLHHVQQAYEALSEIHDMKGDGSQLSNMRLLLLARSAFKSTLEAMGDHETYAKNVISNEHALAVFMCDFFPFVFPLLVNTIKLLMH